MGEVSLFENCIHTWLYVHMVICVAEMCTFKTQCARIRKRGFKAVKVLPVRQVSLNVSVVASNVAAVARKLVLLMAGSST